MPYVKCPSCGERGKIGTALVGARIKCKQCGASFQVAAPAARATAGLISSFPKTEADGGGGIEVEGLDASSWSLSTDEGNILEAELSAEPDNRVTPPSGLAAAGAATERTREYKVLTPKDKFFDGKFDLGRLEEALNHFGRQGWSVKTMSTPHVKGFTGALEETIVVLLER